jgi:hypothetical protein
MIQPERRPAKPAEHIQIGGLGGKCERCRCQCSLAVQAGAAQIRAKEKMGDGFQSIQCVEAKLELTAVTGAVHSPIGWASPHCVQRVAGNCAPHAGQTPLL